MIEFFRLNSWGTFASISCFLPRWGLFLPRIPHPNPSSLLLRHTTLLGIRKSPSTYVAEEPVPLEGTTPVFFAPVGRLVLTGGYRPLHQQALKMDAYIFH